MTKNINKLKVNILTDMLVEFFGDKMNLARIKFFGLFISALGKVQTVCFERLAGSFDSDACCGIQGYFVPVAIPDDV
jgi:hypothetical protein